MEAQLRCGTMIPYIRPRGGNKHGIQQLCMKYFVLRNCSISSVWAIIKKKSALKLTPAYEKDPFLQM